MRVAVNLNNNANGKSRPSKNRMRDDDIETGQQRQTNRRMFQARSSGQRLMINLVACLISLAFAAYFSYVMYYQSSLLNSNAEVDEILWVIFVGLNLALCAIFLIYVVFGLGLAVSLLAMIINIWAIVYIVMSWIGKQGVYHFDIVAASISMVSSIFHSLMVRHCIEKPVRNQTVVVGG